MTLLDKPVFLLLSIVLAGEALGRIKIRSFALGTSAIIFVALAFGHLGYVVPVVLQDFGLVLFIYSIGLQAGPGFLSSFRTHGLRLSVGAVSMILVAVLTTILLSLAFGFDRATASGLLAGAMTSTPGLAVAVELGGGAATAAAYGLTYTFGVLGVILFLKVLARIARAELPREETALDRERSEGSPPLAFCHVELTNPNLAGKQVKDIFLRDMAPVNLTRLLRAGMRQPEVVTGKTVLQAGDHLRVVGREQDLSKAELYLGRRIESDIDFEQGLTSRTVVVSKPEVAGQTLAAMNFAAVFGVQVSRLIRNGLEMPVSGNTQLHRGDQLRLVGEQKAIENVAGLVGNDVSRTFSVNLLVIFSGLFAGYLLGSIPLSLPWIGDFTAGTTGGVLISGLVLSALYKTGPFIWQIPETANNFIRELGLVLFLAAVGTSAGHTLLKTLSEQGLALVFSGLLVTFTPLIVGALLCRKLLGIPYLRIFGVLAGGMTSTPGLATVTGMTDRPYPSSAYATVYPVALIGMIVSTKILVVVWGAV